MAKSDGLVPGALNNLTLEIQLCPGESFYLSSAHHVRLDAAPSSNGAGSVRTSVPRSPSKSQQRQSVTPSPQKLQRYRQAKLAQWTLRLCHQIDPIERARAIESGSATEEDEEEDEGADGHAMHAGSASRAGGVSSGMITAWYIARIDGKRAEGLRNEAGMDTWEMMESKLRAGWDRGGIDVLGRSEDQRQDGTYSHVRVSGGQHLPSCMRYADLFALKLCFTLDNSRTLKQEDDVKTEHRETALRIDLARLEGTEELQEASFVAIEVSRKVI